MAITKERILTNLPSIELPPSKPPTPEELLRRKEIGAKIRELRAKIGPVHGTISELLADEDD